MVTSRVLIEEFLAVRRIAMIGVSRKRDDFSRNLFRSLVEKGYDVVPVNPAIEEIEGRPSYASVRDAGQVQGALLMTSAKGTEAAVAECAEAGIPIVWMYSSVGTGAVSEKAVQFCESHGIKVIAGGCPYMYIEGDRFPHSWHAGFLKLVGLYPR